MKQKQTLIAGIGNIFMGDDAFGVEVIRGLSIRALPDDICVIDFGIRGLDLTYALLDGYETVILVDAMPRGGNPGELYLIEPEFDESEPPESATPMIDMHNMDPIKVLRLVKAMGGELKRLLVVGCEPTPLSSEDDMHMGISPPVRKAVGEAVQLIESLVSQSLESAKSF